MNRRLIFVSIIAIVTAFAFSGIVSGLAGQSAFAAKDCSTEEGLVNANVCNNNICVGASVIGKQNSQKCEN